MIKAVIFDLDGTLKEFNLDTKACRTKIINLLTQQGFSRSLFSLNESAFDMLKKVEKSPIIKDRKIPFTKIKDMVFSVVEEFELEAARTAKIFENIPETLKTLKDMKLKIALCTISSKKTTDYVLKRFHLEHFFDAVVPRESASEVKPHPTHLEAALDALRVRSQEAVLVGDSVKDIQCAVQLNVLAVGVTTGLSSREELTCSGAHYITSSVTDIPILVEQLNRRNVE
ncbi:MAG: HAD family hydrolase [Candidatus Bathyarchaeota archaeon]|jgi:HAD superfamily hydrolase (TIGR01549 family)